MTDSTHMVDEIRRIVGDERGMPIVSPDAASYRDWLAMWLAPDSLPDAVVLPRTVEEIQALVKLAAVQKFSISTTPNLTGVGANITDSRTRSILLDLSQMKRVLEYDDKSAFVLLEPGVTFTDLLSYININGGGFWIDSDHNGANSVAGSVLERHLGFTPYGDHLLMQCGLEVVLANGEVMRTGMGALPNNNTWQLFKFNYGPYLDGLFSRAHNAIVTKVGLWLMPAAPAFYPFQVALTTEAALNATIEVLRPYKLGMVIPNNVSIVHSSADKLLGPQGNITNSAPWNLYGALYGVPKNIELTWGAVQASLQAIDGVAVQGGNLEPADHYANLRVQLMRGVPAYNEATPPRALTFSACASIDGNLAIEMKSIVQTALDAADMTSGEDYSMEYLVSPRALVFRVELPYRQDNYPAAKGAALAAVKALQAKGFTISHDSIELRAAVAGTQTGAGLSNVYEKINSALDPAQILS